MGMNTTGKPIDRLRYTLTVLIKTVVQRSQFPATSSADFSIASLDGVHLHLSVNRVGKGNAHNILT